MTDTIVLELLRQTFWVSLKIAGPVLGTALVVGVGIGIFQAVTQIQEMTLTFVPKAIAVLRVVDDGNDGRFRHQPVRADAGSGEIE